MTTTTRSSRILILGTATLGGRPGVRCLNRHTNEEFHIRKVGRRWFYWATDTPVRDATLKRHAQLALDAL